MTSWTPTCPASRSSRNAQPGPAAACSASPRRWRTVRRRARGRRARPDTATRRARAFPTQAPEFGTGGMLGALPQGNSPGRIRARPKAFVDFQNDVTAKDLALATREGFQAIEHVKRYTTTGMATDQGKTSNMNALGIVAGALGKPIPQVGLTTFRMPYTPVTFGTFAGLSRGDLFDPVRTTPIHGWAVEQGAVFENVELWKRALYFPRGREDMHAAVARECQAVRRERRSL